MRSGVRPATDVTGAHDEVDPSCDGDVVERVPGHRDDVRARAGLEHPDVVAGEELGARTGLSPAATIAWNSRMPWLNGNMPQSVPKATFASLAATRRWASTIRSLSRPNFQTA